MASQGEVYQTFTEHQRRVISYPSETLPKTAEEGTLPNSFYEGTITLIPKDNTQKRKLQANITDEHKCKNPQQRTSKLNPTTH